MRSTAALHPAAADGAGTPVRATRYRWVILAMLFLAMVINFLDRAALSIAMPFMAESFELSAGEKGLIFSSFFVGYALFNFIGGYLADLFGPRRVFLASMTGWSVMCALTALASGFWSLLAIRTLFGVGEGPVPTTANKTVNAWFPLRERARAIGINQAGGPLGGALAGPVVGFTALAFGWQVSFVIIGAVGLCWAAAWWFIAVDDPARHPKVSAAEARLIAGDAPAAVDGSARKVSLREVVTNRSVLTCALSLFCYNYTLFFFLTWFPTYLTDAKGVSLAGMSVLTAFPWLAGATGFLLGGFLIDWVFKVTGRVLFSRKVVLVTSFLVSSACVGLTGEVEAVSHVVALMTVAIGSLMLAAPAYWSIIQDSVPRAQIGTAGGLMHGLGNLSGIVGPALTGFLVQATGQYAAAFLLAGGLGVVGSLVVAFFVRERGVG